MIIGTLKNRPDSEPSTTSTMSYCLSDVDSSILGKCSYCSRQEHNWGNLKQAPCTLITLTRKTLCEHVYYTIASSSSPAGYTTDVIWVTQVACMPLTMASNSIVVLDYTQNVVIITHL